MIKKVFSFIIALVLSVIVLPSVNNKTINAKAGEDKLVIYSWEDYIDLGYTDEDLEDGLSESLTSRFSDEELLESVLDIFTEETGIEVEYCTFATNEEMYNELKKNPHGADLVCPSEYMILKMLKEDMLTSFEMPKNWANYGSPYIQEKFKSLGLANDNEVYACGYMWGTMGYIYNTEYASADELSSWASLLDGKFNKVATIKDSIRDTYIMAVGAVYEEELKSLDKNAIDYNEELTKIFNRTDAETVKKVEEYLKQLKNNIYGFEVDSGKNDMIDGKIQVNFAWSGDAVYVIDEAEAQGKEFGYVVPLEGSNVWFDGWVMPKNADVLKATEFINFVSKPSIAIRNMEYIGYTSCISGAEDEDDEDKKMDIMAYALENSDEDGEVELDLSYFFGKDCILKTATKYGSLATKFPDAEVVKRCAVMDNFNDDDLAVINEMWNRVKFITLPSWLIYAIVVVALLIVVVVVFVKFKDKIFFMSKKKKKWKVISRKEIR